MIITLVPILFTGVAAYYLFGKFISKQLDCPNNNPTVKGLEKSEIKADQAAEKLEAKEEKAAELVILEKDLADLKAVDKGGFMASVPNKLTMNNGLWAGGFLIGLFFIYKLCVMLFRSLFRSIGFEE